jgi:hypothetical protein
MCAPLYCLALSARAEVSKEDRSTTSIDAMLLHPSCTPWHLWLALPPFVHLRSIARWCPASRRCAPTRRRRPRPRSLPPNSTSTLQIWRHPSSIPVTLLQHRTTVVQRVRPGQTHAFTLLHLCSHFMWTLSILDVNVHCPAVTVLLLLIFVNYVSLCIMFLRQFAEKAAWDILERWLPLMNSDALSVHLIIICS